MKRFFFLFAMSVAIWADSFFLLGQEEFSGPKIVSGTRSTGAFPTDAGQFWYEYDITPYTNRYPTLTAPQQSMVRWILFDTGEDFWHTEPFGVFSASKEKIQVYHSAKVQQYISNVLDRFLDPTKRNEQISVQIILLDTPGWRSRVAASLRPYPVKSKELSGWILDGINYTTVIQSLSKRSDYVELNASRSIVPNAETFGWVLAAPEKSYVRDLQSAPNTPQGYVADRVSIDEGYRIEVTPLLSTQGELIEFLFLMKSTVVEKMHAVSLKIPVSNAPRQQLSAEVPQILHAELAEKVSFPKDQVFLLDLGMVPITPGETSEPGLVGNLSKMVTGKSPWRNVLLFVKIANSAIPIPGANPVLDAPLP